VALICQTGSIGAFQLGARKHTASKRQNWIYCERECQKRRVTGSQKLQQVNNCGENIDKSLGCHAVVLVGVKIVLNL
jgi:hypothetical protein